MAGGEVLLKFLEIIFKTLLWLFVISSILLFPLTPMVKACMIGLAVMIMSTPTKPRRKS